MGFSKHDTSRALVVTRCGYIFKLPAAKDNSVQIVFRF